MNKSEGNLDVASTDPERTRGKVLLGWDLGLFSLGGGWKWAFGGPPVLERERRGAESRGPRNADRIAASHGLGVFLGLMFPRKLRMDCSFEGDRLGDPRSGVRNTSTLMKTESGTWCSSRWVTAGPCIFNPARHRHEADLGVPRRGFASFAHFSAFSLAVLAQGGSRQEGEELLTKNAAGQ